MNRHESYRIGALISCRDAEWLSWKRNTFLTNAKDTEFAALDKPP
jgi:hypothetical protein